MSKRRCRNCPDERPTPEPVPPAAQMPVLAIEGQRLWQQAIFACNGLLDMMNGYAMLGVPGVPVIHLRKLAARLNEIITLIERQP